MSNMTATGNTWGRQFGALLNSDSLFIVGLGLVILLSAASHLSGISSGEFLNEDETQYLRSGITTASGFIGNPVWLLRPLAMTHPPLQTVLPIPFVMTLGATEFGLRLAGTLAGIIASGLLYIISFKITSDNRVGFLAGLLHAVSGVAANHKYALTFGLLAPGLLIGFWGLWRFLIDEEEQQADNGLIIAAAGVTWAMMVVQDGLFFIPILAWAYWRRRRLRLTRKSLIAASLIGGWLLTYTIFWGILPRILLPTQFSNLDKILSTASQPGAFHIPQFLGTYLTNTSLIMVILAIPLIFIGLWYASPGLRWLGGWYLLELVMWLFVIEHPLPHSHLLVIFPAFCALFAQGAVQVFDRLKMQVGPFKGVALTGWMALMGLVLVANAWQNFALYGTDQIPRIPASFVFIQSDSRVNGNYRFVRWGQHAAGLYIRDHTEPDSRVVSNFGGSLMLYYADRLNFTHLVNIEPIWNDPVQLRAENMRYLVVNHEYPVPDWIDLAALNLAAQVKVKDQITLSIYDLWHQSSEVIELDGIQGRAAFYACCTNWRAYIHH